MRWELRYLLTSIVSLLSSVDLRCGRDEVFPFAKSSIRRPEWNENYLIDHANHPVLPPPEPTIQDLGFWENSFRWLLGEASPR